jgi:hypothetical protein
MTCMTKRKKLLIIGNKLHGKTTFADFLCEILENAEAFSTSSYLIYRLGLITGASKEEILRDKETYRPQLVKLGNAMCDADAGCLVSICIWASKADTIIIDGVRRISEFSHVKDWFDHIIWVDRPSVPLGLDNLELTAKDADVVISNTGDLKDLQQSAIKLVQDLQIH